jgi:hypothetical protein
VFSNPSFDFSKLIEESHPTEARERSYDAKRPVSTMKQQRSRDNSLGGTIPRSGSKDYATPQSKPQTRGGGRQAQIVVFYFLEYNRTS